MSPLTSPGGRGRPDGNARFRAWLAVLGAAYAAALALASRSTSASLWGIHHAAFLDGTTRALVLGLAALGAALLVLSAARGVRQRVAAPRSSKARGPALATILPLYALPLIGIAFWSFRVRSYFLGDGIVWLANLTSGQFPRFSEPLSTETWHGYTRALHALGLVPDAASLALLSVLCGVITAGLLWLLAREMAPRARGQIAGAALLLTLGVTQLYFGYIESYPIVSVLVVAYLLAGSRAARSERPEILPGIALALVAAAHIVSLLLAPSYVWLVARMRAPLWRRALLLLVPAILAAGLFAWLRFSVADLLRPFHTMETALQGGSGAFGFTARGFLSARRWVDLLNLALLLAPVPIVVLGARLLAGWGHHAEGATSSRAPVFLAMAGAPGLLAALFLVVPGSPAQDWDLLAIVLLPAAVAAVAATLPALERASRPALAGLAILGLAGLSGFVLVNADEAAGLRRFTSLVGEDAALRPHERAYGNEKLATYWSNRGDYDRALVHARRAVEAEPANPRYWVKAGGALVSLGRQDEAVPFFTEAIRRDPGRADAYYDLGICYAKAERYDEAVGAFRSAVLRDGDRPDYRHNLGLMLYAAGKPDSARLVWMEVLRRWEGYPLTVRSMARRFGGAESTATAAMSP
ncbi:MAG TPA: tetratricopeptide repeat protein [Candidatus Binatia bacterium]|nr:tetratricopeptide repeat protein [Candidatus Binatia bacterium]